MTGAAVPYLMCRGVVRRCKSAGLSASYAQVFHSVQSFVQAYTGAYGRMQSHAAASSLCVSIYRITKLKHPGLAKRNGVSPKEKRPLVRVFLIAGRTLCCTYREQLPCPSGRHVRPRRRLPRASTARLPTTSPSPGANGAFRFALTTERHCQRRVRPAIKKT